jgi:hypothetical protein
MNLILTLALFSTIANGFRFDIESGRTKVCINVISTCEPPSFDALVRPYYLV